MKETNSINKVYRKIYIIRTIHGASFKRKRECLLNAESGDNKRERSSAHICIHATSSDPLICGLGVGVLR